MASTTKVLVAAKQLESTQTTQYTATNCRAVIIKASIGNTDTVNRTVTVNLVSSGGTAGNGNKFLINKTIVPGETYLCPELVGRVLDPGDFISTIASASTSLTIKVDGQEIT